MITYRLKQQSKRRCATNEVLKGMMDEEYEERVLSSLIGRRGYHEEYSTIHEFKEDLNQAVLAEEKLKHGWVFWRAKHHKSKHTSQLQHKIRTLLKHIASMEWGGPHYLAQFWAVIKVEGRIHYLSTSNQPFCVPNLRKGLCWYREQCMDDVYGVDVEGAEEEKLGIIGRAYRNKQPESTPDLMLYSMDEFPLRDHAARCGFRGYWALPLFDLHHKSECYGVLELFSDWPVKATPTK